MAGGLFLVVIGGLVARGMLPLEVLILYLASSMASVVAYAADKAAARQGRWRTAESTLHLLAVVGGWPGALIAQKLFRHKSRKPSFQTAFLFTVVLNCALLFWFWWMESL